MFILRTSVITTNSNRVLVNKYSIIIIYYISFPCVAGTPIQKAKDLLQENQVLLNTVPASSQDRGPSRGTATFPQGAEMNKAFQRESVLYSPNSRRGRGGREGRRGRRGRHQDPPQKRRHTLLEMVRIHLHIKACFTRIYIINNIFIFASLR